MGHKEAPETRGILLDIEGTTTPISFVHEVLFSYAKEHVRDYLTRHFDSEDVRADLQLLQAEHAPLDVNDIESIVAHVNLLIVRDSKSTGLKSLQGKIWEEGYRQGSLQSQVFEDVAPALARWRQSGLSINIFSSGSVLAQQLLFAHTNAGDLTPLIDNYFDTGAGKKTEAGSYQQIAAAVDLQPSEITFISDVVKELAAAREAGMKTLLTVRPGNQPQESAAQYEIIKTFDEVTATHPGS